MPSSGLHPLARLSQWQLDAGELTLAQETVSRWLVHDPFSDVANLRLIQVHSAAGNRTSALRAYESYRVRLTEAMNVTPSVDTAALAAYIRAQVFPALASEQASSPPPPTASFIQPAQTMGASKAPSWGERTSSSAWSRPAMPCNGDRRG